MSVSFNPVETTGFTGNFVPSTDGYVQGMMLDDVAIRYQIEGAVVGSGVSQPLWAGQAVAVNLPAKVGANTQGSIIVPATSAGTINAFTVLNQASAGIITPTSNVPLYGAGASANIVRVGTGARIVVAVENGTILGDLTSASTTTQLYWDPTNLCVTNSAGGNYALAATTQIEALSNSSKTVLYSAPSATWVANGFAAVIRI